MSFSLFSFAICRLAAVPVRRFPDLVSEMTTQICFGEGVEILAENRGLWQVRLCRDGYEGWVDARQFTMPQRERPPLAAVLTAELAAWAERQGNDRPERCLLPLGTPLPVFEEGRFWIGSESWRWTGAIHRIPAVPCWDGLLKQAACYQNTPYLWGGRSLWGIDCSGLVQSLLQHQGITVSRDCQTQVNEGSEVPSLCEAKPGDLAFFDGVRDGGWHVGLVLENSKVLHASGYVRVDILTDRGIWVQETSHLSHYLRALRRVATWSA